MKTVYLVRHGESESNVGERFVRDEDASLTMRGRGQAASLAKRCAKLGITTMISSTIPRAVQTAQIISMELGLPVVHSADFVEPVLPEKLFGRLRHDEESARLVEEWFDTFTTKGDFFDDIRARAARASTMLEDEPDAPILVVTHGVFMRILLTAVLFGKTFSPEHLGYIRRAIPNTEKTHLSVLRYYEDGRKDPWKLWVWNDHAHLG